MKKFNKETFHDKICKSDPNESEMLPEMHTEQKKYHFECYRMWDAHKINPHI